MSFIPYQNYGAGLGAIGPVQTMSDRAENQTLMANNGQMFASGGLASLAEGGSTALPKYKYDPVLQRYTLVNPEGEVIDEELELLKKRRAVESGGGGSSTPEPSAWSQMTPGERAAYYAANPLQAKLALGAQNLLGYTGIGALSKFFAPDAWYSSEAEKRGFDPSQTSFGRERTLFGLIPGQEAVPKAGADVYGYGYSKDAPINMNYNGSLDRDPDAPSLFNPVPSSGYGDINYSSPSADTSSYDPSQSYGGGDTTSPSSADTTAADNSGIGGWATGGLAALARGGQSHLGDYSDGGRLLRGPGDGVSDSIPAVIGKKRPARLADGEFVVPARIVSELGNGSTEAGARKLYAMMDRIQKGRKKSIGKDRVAVNSRADKNLPA